MAAGRPTELTKKIIADVKRVLPKVLYIETVADFIGVDRFTVRRWLKRGAKELKRLRRPRARPRPTEALYAEFCAAVKKAVADGEIRDAGVIQKASAKQWQAAAWRLERRFPDRWGRKDQIKSDVSIQELDRLIELELARLAGSGQAQIPGETPTAPDSPETSRPGNNAGDSAAL